MPDWLWQWWRCLFWQQVGECVGCSESVVKMHDWIISLLCTWLRQLGGGRWSVEQTFPVHLVMVQRKYWSQYFDWAVNLEGLPLSNSSALNPPFQLSGTSLFPLGLCRQVFNYCKLLQGNKSIYIWVKENINVVPSFLSIHLSYFATLSALSSLALPGCHLKLKRTFWFPPLVFPFRYG